MVGKTRTVLGAIDPGAMGLTLPHEHLSGDLSFALTSVPQEPKGMQTLPWTLENLGYIQQFPFCHKNNLYLNDREGESAVTQSVSLFKQSAGGSCIVENSTLGWNRNTKFLRELSANTGVHIVAGTGFYLEDSLWKEDLVSKAQVEKMSNFCTDEILVGCHDDPSVKCGFIGEVGVSNKMTDMGTVERASTSQVQELFFHPAFERKSIQASAWTQQATGAAVGFHPGRSKESAFEIMRVYLEAGGKADRAILCHSERTFDTLEDLSEFAQLGTVVQFDLFGFESYLQPFTFPNDSQRIDMIQHLIREEGKTGKILASSDIHTKHSLETYGGRGYKYVIKYATALMKHKGMTDRDIQQLFVDNPANIFPF